MKIEIDIPDDVLCAALRAAMATNVSTSLPRVGPIKPHELENLWDCLEFCVAANRVIEYFGGAPVDFGELVGEWKPSPDLPR